MKPDDVLKRIVPIFEAAKQHDHETAHVLEDRLHQDVLLAIARGDASEPTACADAALRTQGIDFERWCA